jgi:DNA helicase-2/ATP-dependent DNA helicase PcrA
MQVNPFLAALTPAAPVGGEVSFDDDLPSSSSKPVHRPAFSALHKAQLQAWLDKLALDPDQRATVAAEPLGLHKVEANAGSGKTFTLIARAIRILIDTDALPSDLVLLTFTNKAAKEIKERYRKVVQEVTGMERVPMPYIGTIHGFAYSLVQKTGNAMSIVGESSARTALRRLIKNDLFPERKEMFDMVQVRRIQEAIGEAIANNELHCFALPIWDDQNRFQAVTWRDPSYATHLPTFRYLDETSRTVSNAVFSAIPEDRSDVPGTIDPEMRNEIRRYYAEKASTAENKITPNELTTIIQHSLQQKYVNGTLDFGDLLYYPLVQLVQSPRRLARIWERPRFIFQDEAQDQDTVQYSLLRLYAGEDPNILLCADTKQTLYFWRSARPDLTDGLGIVAARKLPLPGGVLSAGRPVHSHQLRTNYRSASQIVDLANLFALRFTSKANAPSYPFRDKGRNTCGIRTYADSTEEYKAIAVDISTQIRTGERGYADFAVLTRTNNTLLELEASFIAMRIPYNLKKDNKATTRQSTFRVLAAHYALVLNPRDSSSFCELLEPVKGLGDKFLQALQSRLNAIFARDPKATVMNVSVEQMAAGANPSQKQWSTLINMREKMLRPFLMKAATGKTTVPDLSADLRAMYSRFGNFEIGEGYGTPDITKEFDWQFTLYAFDKVIKTLDNVYLTLQDEEDFAILGEQEKIATIHGILALGSDDGTDDDLEELADGKKVKKPRVTLATGHAFKGKQAPVVYVAALRGRTPIDPYDPNEEDRCWFYVAITRPEDRLILTCSEMSPDYTGRLRKTYTNPLLEEMQECMERYRGGFRVPLPDR